MKEGVQNSDNKAQRLVFSGNCWIMKDTLTICQKNFWEKFEHIIFYSNCYLRFKRPYRKNIFKIVCVILEKSRK